MWQRTNFCATPYPYMPPSPTAPDDVRNDTPFCIYNFVSTDFFPLLAPALAQFTLAGPGGLTGWRMPRELKLRRSTARAVTPSHGLTSTLKGSTSNRQSKKYSRSTYLRRLLDRRSVPGRSAVRIRSPHRSHRNSGLCNHPFQATVDASCKSVNSVSDGSLAIAVRNPTPAETYRSICDANGQNCVVSCGPADDPNSEICPVP